MKIGLYFGTFNPIHNGHLIIANYILQYAKLDQVWLIVSPQNPFKQNHSLLNEYHRLFLVQKAIEGESNMKAVDIEFSLPKPSYTIDTMTYLEEKYPEHQFCIIMGSDSFQNLEKWKSGSLIMTRYPIYIYVRSGFEVDQKKITENIVVLKAPLLDISASLIRKKIGEGKSVRYLIPDSVNEEIVNAGYYKS
ncbi:MAG: nicotinate-nucleotide adenylyltransferase [Chitinophagia bacterium]|nr:nicotinate-nucleotide adenylyltransferase [Chitinophagia bacterium]